MSAASRIGRFFRRGAETLVPGESDIRAVLPEDPAVLGRPVEKASEQGPAKAGPHSHEAKEIEREQRGL